MAKGSKKNKERAAAQAKKKKRVEKRKAAETKPETTLEPRRPLEDSLGRPMRQSLVCMVRSSTVS